MTSFVIKLIAYICMFLSHMGTLLYMRVPYEYYYVSYLIGRLCFPIFAYFIVEGWKYTKSKYKYLLRLLIFGLVSAVPFYLAFDYGRSDPGFEFDVIITLFLGACCLLLQDLTWDKMEPKFRFLVILSLLPIVPGIFIEMDFGWYGILTIWLLGFVGRLTDEKWVKILVLMGAMALTYMVPMRYRGWISFLCTFPAYIMLLLYNGKRGPRLGYFFYIFYPAHLILVFVLNYFLPGGVLHAG